MAKRKTRRDTERRGRQTGPNELASPPELVVIARPEARVRATERGVRAAARGAGADLQAVLERAGARLRPLFGSGEERLLRERAVLSAGPAPGAPDLSVFYRVEGPARGFEKLAARMRERDIVLAAYVKPPTALPARLNVMRAAAAAAPPASPEFSARQGYLDPAPAGIDARFAWTVPGGTGTDVRIIDIEGGWRFSHEDLLQNQGGLAGGTQYPEVDWRNHGTAVIGEIGGDANAFGVSGIAPEANVKGISHGGGLGSAGAIQLAASMLRPGDVILLEMHRPGPNSGFVLRPDQRGYIAVEWWPDDYAAIRYAIARGVIVIEAAGNGAENLDDAIYDVPQAGFPSDWANPFRRGARDSGAIVVGAGAPPPGTHGVTHGPDRSRLDFSNFGSVVDAQGWGREVTTTGYGDLQGGSNEDLWYTDRFSGTSSASPIVTGAVACVQGATRTRGLPPLSPAAVRNALRATGSAQQAAPARPIAQRIGTRPDIRQVLAFVNGDDEDEDMKQPAVRIVSYDEQLLHGGTWRAVVEDANNPGQQVTIEFIKDSFHVTWQNPKGQDRSARERPVRID
jgi:hypothetical protein